MLTQIVYKASGIGNSTLKSEPRSGLTHELDFLNQYSKVYFIDVRDPWEHHDFSLKQFVSSLKDSNRYILKELELKSLGFSLPKYVVEFIQDSALVFIDHLGFRSTEGVRYFMSTDESIKKWQKLELFLFTTSIEKIRSHHSLFLPHYWLNSGNGKIESKEASTS